MRASVIICTFNRSNLLREAIASIQKQDFPSDQYEIIVVDNNSTDDTKDVVAEMAKASPVRIGYVFEDRQGLSNARNAGINNSEGEIIIFTDDDVEAERSWLRELVTAFDNPGVAAAGGPIRPIWPFEKPGWLTDNMLSSLTISEFSAAAETGEFKYPDCPFGANMAFHKDVFSAAGLFLPELGRTGECLLSNEELDLCRRLWLNGKKVKFVPGAVIYHKIPLARLRKAWFYRRYYYQGKSDAVLVTLAKGDIYGRLRGHGAAIFWREVHNRAQEFENKCFNRVAKGYLHALLFSYEKGAVSGFRRLRTLETFLRGLMNNAINNIRERNDQIRQMTDQLSAVNKHLSEKQGQLTERDGQLWKAHEWLKERNSKIEEMQGTVTQKNDLLRQRDDLLRQAQERLKESDAKIEEMQGTVTQKNDLLRQRDDLLRQKDDLLTQKDEQLASQTALVSQLREQAARDRETILELEKRVKDHEGQFRQKCEQLIEVDNKFKLKCVEVVSKDETLVRLCEEKSGELQRFEKELRRRDEHIADLLNSMSWKITSPLRAVYGILLWKKKK